MDLSDTSKNTGLTINLKTFGTEHRFFFFPKTEGFYEVDVGFQQSVVNCFV